VAADRAAANAAEVNLGYTLITAPIAGRTGALQLTVGNVLRAGDTRPLIVLRQMSPIYVSFSLPAANLPNIRRYSAEGSLRVEATPVGPGAVPLSGALAFLDNAVDATTGTITLWAIFSNEERTLWPGQFADVTLILTMLSDTVVITAQSLQVGQQGRFVFVIGPDLTVQARPVEPGPRLGNLLVIEKGIQPGEKVVTDGQLGLTPGAKVQIKPPVGVPAAAPPSQAPPVGGSGQ
jgi:multidrug efflux system membrane fusion protein